MIVAFLVGLAATAASAAQPIVVTSIVDGFAGTFPVVPALLLIALLLASAAFTAVRQLIMQRSGERFAFDTRRRIIRHIYAMPMDELERRDRADLVSRVTTDVSQIREIFTSGLVELACSGVTVVVSVVLMATIDPLLLSLVVAAVAIILVSIFLLGRRTRPAGLHLQEALGQLAGTVSRTLGAMKTIRASRSVGRETDASASVAATALRAGFSVAGLRAVVQTFGGISIQILLIVVMGAGALRVSTGAISTGELSAFIMYLMLMAAPLAMFGGIISTLGVAFGALSRVLDIEEAPTECDVESPELGQQDSLASEALFLLDDVSFSYAPATPDQYVPPALLHASMAIREGQVTAVVGPSGAGKTTLFALLERFYEPSRGRILFHGRDVKGISRDDLRSQIAYVDQDAAVLSGSVRDNIALASPTASEEECIDALLKVNLAPDPMSARRLLRHQVGESGTRLSGGERQRLAVARAIVAQTPILLLDEITSNLDSRSEALVQDVLLSDEVRRTVIVIAHRFSTVVSASTIIVLDHGHVVAQGSHASLMAECPLYRELAELQFVTESAGVAR
nr:ABC transporter ATP-binding protein [Propionicimonas sp.]